MTWVLVICVITIVILNEVFLLLEQNREFPVYLFISISRTLVKQIVEQKAIAAADYDRLRDLSVRHTQLETYFVLSY